MAIAKLAVLRSWDGHRDHGAHDAYDVQGDHHGGQGDHADDAVNKRRHASRRARSFVTGPF